MKRHHFFLLLLFVVLHCTNIHGQSTDLKQIEAKIKELDSAEATLNSSLEMWKLLQTQLANGELMLIPTFTGSYLAPKKNFKDHIATMLLTERMTPELVPNYMRKCTQATSDFAKEVDLEVKTDEKWLRKVKDELVYYLNERIRLKDVASSSPGPVGKWDISWNDPYANYQFQWEVRAVGAAYQVRHKLISTNHTVNKNLIGQSWDDVTLTPADDGKFTLRRASIDQNPGNAGYFEQVATCTIGASSLSCVGEHKGTRLTHFIKIEGSKK